MPAGVARVEVGRVFGATRSPLAVDLQRRIGGAGVPVERERGEEVVAGDGVL